jgi:hypothetical protein
LQQGHGFPGDIARRLVRLHGLRVLLMMLMMLLAMITLRMLVIIMLLMMLTSLAPAGTVLALSCYHGGTVVEQWCNNGVWFNNDVTMV